MLKYIVKRILMLIPVLLGVTFIVFFILSLSPGNPAAIILGESATEESLRALEIELGLDKPVVVRYINYMLGVFRGDFGESYRTGLSVSEQIFKLFPNTIILAVSSMFIAIAIGVIFGIIAAKKQYSIIDNASMITALLGTSMPNFWFGLVVVMIFSVNLGWLPSSGMGSTPKDLLLSLILPALTLGTGAAGNVTRMTRSSMLEVIRQDYISTARAKGLKEMTITTRHMLSNALIPIVTVIGLQFGTMLGGAILTETVFAWPGLGRYMIDAIKGKDIPCVLGTVIFMAVVFTLVNLLVDILYMYIDPRMKSQVKS